MQTQRRLHNAGANMTTIKKEDLINLNATVPFTQTQTASEPAAAEPTLAQRLKRGESPSPFMSYATKPQSAGQAAYNADGFTNAQAASIMQQAGDKAFSTGAKIDNAAQKNVVSAKLINAKLLQEQVKGEQKAAGLNLLGAVAGAGANFGGAFKSSALTRDGKHAGVGMGLQGITQSGVLGQTVQNLVSLYDKILGGSHEADVAKIAQKNQDAKISMMQGIADSSKAQKDAGKSFWEKAIDFTKAMIDTKKSAEDNIANK